MSLRSEVYGSATAKPPSADEAMSADWCTMVHDLSNLLTRAAGYSKCALEQAATATCATLREDLTEVVIACDKAAALVRQFDGIPIAGSQSRIVAPR
ncbi:MAG TPA: hypothetical protein VG713_04150 [Pirellulales bacterium]|nr:hypothetical protein [Pirellulales bacterium]